MLDQHIAGMDEAISVLSSHVDVILSQARITVSSTLRSSLQISDDGGVVSTPENVAVIGTADLIFKNAMESLGYREAVSSFVSKFSNQVDVFLESFEDMRRRFPNLPEARLSPADRELISGRAAASVMLLDGVLKDAAIDVRRNAALSLSGTGLESVILFVHDGMRRMTTVKQMAKDLALSFFRFIGNLVYAGIEANGVQLKYQYTGSLDENSRPFCRDLLKSGKIFARDEIESMSNEQIPGVFVFAGGHACSHWWSIAEVKRVS